MQVREAFQRFRKSQYFWAVPIVLVLIFAAILLIRGCTKEKEPKPVYVLSQESWYLPLGLSFSGADAFLQSNAEIVLVYGKEQEGIYQNEAGACYLRTYTSLLDVKGPIYQKNGAMIAFPEIVDRYRVIYSNFTVEDGHAGMQYTVGAAFDSQNQKMNSEKVFLLQLDAYHAAINSESFRVISGESATEIAPNSILVFGASALAVYRFNGHALEKCVVAAAGSTMIENTEFRVSYADLYRFMSELETKDSPDPVVCGEDLAGDFCYYDLDVCFDIQGPSKLFQSAEGLYLENETHYYTLHNAPLLEKNECYWWLPADYEVVALNGFTYKKIPAKSVLRPAEQSACIVTEGKEHYVSDCFFYDGKENYILTQDTELVLSDRIISISAFSRIFVRDTQSFAVYVFENNTYEVYFIKGSNPEISFPGFGKLNFMKHSFLHDNGRTDYLLSNPEILKGME